MLFGESTDYTTASMLLSECMEAGASFFDTAEMYPVPQAAHTSGDSERMLGRWLKEANVPRDKVIVATKVAGPSGQMTWIRGGPHKVDAANIRAAIDGSLARLGTDYLDVVYVHWPDRYVPMFGDTDYDPGCAYSGAVPLEEQLGELGRAVAAGKVRAVGLSNETPYGLTRAVMAADASGGTLPRVAVLSNALSLTCRTFDTGLAEVCAAEGVAMAAYSPLAMGLLTGKYLQGGGPPQARLNRYRGRYAEAESRYGPKPNVREAVAAYCTLAQQAGMSPTEMAIRWVVGHPLVTTAVIGATSLDQLREQVRAALLPRLPDDLLSEIDRVHARYPSPTP